MIAQLRPDDIVTFRLGEDRTVYVVDRDQDSLGHVDITPLVADPASPRVVRTVPVKTVQRIP
jgi:hypothetical protein